MIKENKKAKIRISGSKVSPIAIKRNTVFCGRATNINPIETQG